MADPLSKYRKMRDFTATSEPAGGKRKPAANTTQKLQFVVQKHDATRLHYDFRLELDGVLKSWAVTKGPSFNPDDKRLAVRVEDHPFEYRDFEGVIPDRHYGAGPVIVWDNGWWEPEFDPHEGLAKGHLSFTLHGQRLKGQWHLVHMKGRDSGTRENWLLMKVDDRHATPGEDGLAYLEKNNTSIVSSHTVDEVRANPDRVYGHKKTKDTSARPVAKKTKEKAKGKAVTLSTLEKEYGKVALATLVEFPPEGDDWLHEIKYDGYRLLCMVSDGKVMLRTRGGQDWTHKFQGIADAVAKLDVRDAVLDCEAVVHDDRGVSSFSMLQQALHDKKGDTIEAWLFDLLHLDGTDLRRKPLTERKALLQALLPAKNRTLHFSEDFESTPDLLGKACSIGAEGIISKRKDSAYSSRRGHDWLKSKCGHEQEFVIGGFMPAKNNPHAIGALLLGYYKNRKLHYAGKVGTGYTVQMAKDIYKRLHPLETETAPFVEKPERGERAYVFVRPEVLAEIRFWEWTPEKHIRHASFKGLREDKKPAEVIEEKAEKPPAAKRTAARPKKSDTKTLVVEDVTISHPEREMFPGEGITKGDLAAYYGRAAPYIMPFLSNRLASIVRCPDDIAGTCFFQRSVMKGMNGHIHGLTVSHKGNRHNYLYVDDATGLLGMVQFGTVELHAWQSHIKTNDKPDQIILDFDPSPEVPFEAVKLAALDARARLEKHGLESFPRLTGGKGIHVVAPIKPEHGWDEVKEFTRALAQEMERDVPDAYVSNMSKKKRNGKIFIDFFRNDYSATAIVPFSVRSRKGAPVAVPLTWEKLEKMERADAFNIGNIDRYLNKSTMALVEKVTTLRQRLKLR